MHALSHLVVLLLSPLLRPGARCLDRRTGRTARVRRVDGVVRQGCCTAGPTVPLHYPPAADRHWFESSPRGHALTSLQNPNPVFKRASEAQRARGRGPPGGDPTPHGGASAGLQALPTVPTVPTIPTVPRACLCYSSHMVLSCLLVVSGTVSSAALSPGLHLSRLRPVWSPGRPPVRASPSEQRPWWQCQPLPGPSYGVLTSSVDVVVSRVCIWGQNLGSLS